MHSVKKVVGKAGRPLLAAFLMLFIVGIVMLLSHILIWLNPEPRQDDANCLYEDVPSVANGQGIVATAHIAACGYFIAHSDGITYIYVHRTNEMDSYKSLVFSFSNRNDTQLPRMTWVDKSTLHILVNTVGEITRQRESADDVTITYTIGKVYGHRGRTKVIVICVIGILLMTLAFSSYIFVVVIKGLLGTRFRRSP